MTASKIPPAVALLEEHGRTNWSPIRLIGIDLQLIAKVTTKASPVLRDLSIQILFQIFLLGLLLIESQCLHHAQGCNIIEK